MNLIILSGRDSQPRHIDLKHPLALTIIGAAVLLVAGIAFILGRQLGISDTVTQPARQAAELSRQLKTQEAQIADLRHTLKDHIDALAKRVGLMNAHIVRLDTLGRRLTKMAKIDEAEFNFSSAPAQGGPEENDDQAGSSQIPELTAMIDRISRQVQDREVQLGVLENLIMTRNLNEQIYPEGRPVVQGWISSFFGRRADPFSGYSATHKGLDFAGKAGTQVTSVAAGVVTWAGDRSGYGQLVEINHGNGYSTRYGHNQRNLVRAGQTIQKGQAVALMGSTGRSTGPHVHFEVLRNGQQVNPLKFIGQAP